jgi:uncharacterized protein with HEPN domain
MTAAGELRVSDFPRHVLDEINQIEIYTAGVDQLAFLESRVLRDAVIRNIEIIGEAADNVPKLDSEFGRRHPDIPPQAAYAMRNSRSHGYFRVDPALVRGTVQADLPPFEDTDRRCAGDVYQASDFYVRRP